MSWISVVVGLAGGVGLLLFGLRVAVDGVRVAGGSMLLDNLWRWASDRRRSFATGMVGGAVLPASSTLQETGCGLAGAGLVNGRHALWLLMGAGSGAVVAAGLVTVTGQGALLRLTALTVLAVGVIAPRMAEGASWSTWSKGLVGLGLAGVGLDVMARTFGEWSALSNYPGIDVNLPVRATLTAIAGAALGWTLRSTSLALASVLLACGAGLISTASGLGWALGIPIGTALLSLPAMRSSVNGTRRTAVALATGVGLQVVIGAVAIACSLPLLAAPPGPLTDPMLFVGLFSALTTLAAAGVMAAIDRPLMGWLEEQWPEGEEAGDGGAGLFVVPELARQALINEVHGLVVTNRNLARALLSEGGATDFRVREDLASLRARAQAVGSECARLVADAPPVDVARAGALLPSAAHLQVQLGEALVRVRAGSAGDREVDNVAVRSRMRQFSLGVLHLVESGDPLRSHFSLRQLDGERRTVEAQLRDLRRRYLALHREAALSDAAVEVLLEAADRLWDVARCATEAGHSFGLVLGEPEVATTTVRVDAPVTAGPDAPVPATSTAGPSVVPIEDTAVRQRFGSGTALESPGAALPRRLPLPSPTQVEGHSFS